MPSQLRILCPNHRLHKVCESSFQYRRGLPGALGCVADSPQLVQRYGRTGQALPRAVCCGWSRPQPRRRPPPLLMHEIARAAPEFMAPLLTAAGERSAR